MFVRLQVTINNHQSWESFLVTDIGRQNLIIDLSYLRHHNPKIDWKKESLVFNRCPSICLPYNMQIQDEDLDGLSLQHLEEAAQDEYGVLTDDEWASSEQFLHWLQYSDDPTAIYLRNLNEETDKDNSLLSLDKETKDKAAEAREIDKGYWLPIVPEQYLSQYYTLIRDVSIQILTV